jgi:hypothetical protein
MLFFFGDFHQITIVRGTLCGNNVAMRMLLLFSLLLATGSAFAQTNTVYVSPTGNDTNSGTISSPFRSLAKARDTIAARTRNSTNDFAVVLRNGTHTLTSTLEFTARHSGRPGHPVVYRCLSGETAILSGGRRVTGWTPDTTNGIWKAQAPVEDFRQFYVNGTRRPRAHGQPPSSLTPVGDEGYHTTFADIADWKNPDAMELVYLNTWCHTRCRVKTVRRDDNGAFIEMLPTYYEYARIKEGVQLNEPESIENAFELLDEPGEWYLDRPEKTLYYKPAPGEDLSRDTTIVPALEQLVSINGTLDEPVHDLIFSGITFADAGWLGPNATGLIDVQANFTLNLTNMIKRDDHVTDIHNEHKKSPANIVCHAGKSIQFDHCRFTRLGGAGLDIEDGSQDNTVIGCEFTDISGSAIQVGDVRPVDHHPRDKRHIVKNNTLTGNDIHHVAVEYNGGVGIFVGYTEATRILRNHIHDLPYSGVSVGWGWGEEDAGGGNPVYRQPFHYDTPTTSCSNLVVSNHIHNVMQRCYDGGAIYTLGNMPGSVIGWNHIHDNPGTPGGIYLDEGSGFIEVTGNLVYAVGNPMNYNNEVQDRKATCNEHDNFFGQAPDDQSPARIRQIIRNAGIPIPPAAETKSSSE